MDSLACKVELGVVFFFETIRDTYARNDNLNRRPAFLHQLDSPNTALVRWHAARSAVAPATAVTHCSSAPLSYGSTTAASLLPRRRAARAPRHSATCCHLCTAPPHCCRAVSLLPRRFATATLQRVLLSDALEPIAVGLGAFQNMLGIMYCGCMFVATSLLSVYCPLLHRPVRLDSDIMGELKESRAYRHHDSHDSLRRHCHRRRQHRHSHPACSQ